MKRRAVYFLLCVCFCFSHLSLSCFAVDQDLIDEGYVYNPSTGDYYIPQFEEPNAAASDEEETTYSEEHQMLLDEGFIYDPNLGIYYIDEEMPMLDSGYMPYFSGSPNYPKFNPDSIPWETAPGYIKEILYNTPFIATTDTTYVDPWKIPFVLVITNGSIARVIVGINIGLYTYFPDTDSKTSFTPTGTYVACEVLDSSGNIKPGIDYACCYEAIYDIETLEITVDWHSLTPIALGNRVSRFTNSLVSTTINWDYYCYGGNNVGPGKTSVVIPIKTNQTSTYPAVIGVSNASYGFAGGSSSFIYGPDNYPYAYFTSFVPSTFEEKQLDTSKGILSSVKDVISSVGELPGKISDKLKGLFIPSDGYFDTYTQSFQDYFSDRFGLLYELPDKMVDILQQFINYSPSESGYSIHFPEVVMPVLDNGEWSDRVLIEESDVTFDFLEQGAFKTLYSMYRSVVWMIFIFALINLIIRKANKVFGGAS